jgi:drug/metabolite transporter (DMT)-like permease
MPPATRLVPPLFVVLWATGFIGARYAMPWAEPFTFLAARFLIAFAVLAAFLIFWRVRKASVAGALHAVAAGMLMHGIYLGGVFWAIHRGMPAGISALIVGLQPLITALMARPMLGERILPKHWLGLGLGFAGVVIVLSPKFGAIGGITPATLAAAVIAVVAMSLGTVLQKRFGDANDPVSSALYQYLGAAALMVAASLALETRSVTVNGELVFATVWLVFVLSIGAIFLLMYMIRKGEMSKVASLFYLVPAVTAVIAWVLFNESLTLVQVAGMALTTFGVGLATQARTRDLPPDSG